MMATKDKIADVRPYVERALKDEELRDNVLAALAAAKDVYADLVGDRGVTSVASKLATDKDIQDNLKKAIDELRSAADRIQGKDDHSPRNTMLLPAVITAGTLSTPRTGPQTGRWLMDRITGDSSNDSSSPPASEPTA